VPDLKGWQLPLFGDPVATAEGASARPPLRRCEPQATPTAGSLQREDYVVLMPAREFEGWAAERLRRAGGRPDALAAECAGIASDRKLRAGRASTGTDRRRRRARASHRSSACHDLRESEGERPGDPGSTKKMRATATGSLLRKLGARGPALARRLEALPCVARGRAAVPETTSEKEFSNDDRSAAERPNRYRSTCGA
jgi:hypothetical protein